jgi:hypothetical protein
MSLRKRCLMFCPALSGSEKNVLMQLCSEPVVVNVYICKQYRMNGTSITGDEDMPNVVRQHCYD